MLFAESSEFFKELKEWLTVIGVIVAAVLSYLAKRDAGKAAKDAGEAKDEAVKAVPIREAQGVAIEKIETGLGETKHAVEEIHKATNSMKDALVQATHGQALAEGTLAGVKQEQERTAGQERPAQPPAPVPVVIVPADEPLPVAVVKEPGKAKG